MELKWQVRSTFFGRSLSADSSSTFAVSKMTGSSSIGASPTGLRKGALAGPIG
jgi:hypothetical protein